MNADYDSAEDTKAHIEKAREFITEVIGQLINRRIHHDLSKLEPPEKPIFDEYTPKLKATTYGNDEYKRYLAEMGVALIHHYNANRHHPEHFQNGIDDMTLIDLIEMLCDWKAATLRHENGDILRSLEINQDRFEIPLRLVKILRNTVKAMNW